MKLISCLIAATAAASAFAQGPSNVIVGPMAIDFGGDAGHIDLLDHAFTFENGQAKGKPFSAEQTTESVHTLGDGNRIVTSKRVHLSRDGEGRVRREITVREGGEEKTSISISDPVAGVSYALDPATRTARKVSSWPKLDAKLEKLNERLSGMNQRFPKLKLDQLNNQLAGASRQLAQIQSPNVYVTIPELFIPPMQLDLVEPEVLTSDVHAKGYSKMHEDLGDDKVEGVTAHGTRDTTKIPAGAIGNEKAIVIISERWFAPDLGLEVKAMRSDPRYGETRVSLSHVGLAEPDHSLFQVPPDYKTLSQDSLGSPLLPAPAHPKAH